jgi:hypothetical protein
VTSLGPAHAGLLARLAGGYGSEKTRLSFGLRGH